MSKVLLGFFILLVLFYVATPSPHSLAKTSITPIKTALARENIATLPAKGNDEATQSSTVIDEYPLPYPGILPDNPLHFLKALRDRIISFLISDPVKKAEFNLLTSDKRIYAAQILADKGKGSIAISTLSKSNNYFHNALSSASEAKKMGKDIDAVLISMKKAVVKHQQVISMIKRVVSKEFSNQLRIEQARLVEFEKSVDSLLLKKQ